MNTNLQELLEIKDCMEPGYHTQVAYGGWRAAYLNETEKFHIENITEMQRHNTSDEVFILLQGECILYIGDGTEKSPGEITAVRLEQGVMYNVRKGVWHTHALKRNARVIVIEDIDVSAENTDYIRVELTK